jgi:thiosulfate dehydrogenase
MPYGTTWQNPILTVEQAWDVAAFISVQDRPATSFAYDWPDITKKPFDYPFGPYKDSLSELRHKLGPWK